MHASGAGSFQNPVGWFSENPEETQDPGEELSPSEAVPALGVLLDPLSIIHFTMI